MQAPLVWLQVQNKRDKAVEDIATTSKEIEALEADIAKLREERCMVRHHRHTTCSLVDSHTAGCPHQDSRADKLAQLAATRAEIEKLDARLLVQRENDPAALQEMSMLWLLLLLLLTRATIGWRSALTHVAAQGRRLRFASKRASVGQVHLVVLACARFVTQCSPSPLPSLSSCVFGMPPDNVWAMKDYLVKKHSMVPKQVDQAMGIPEEFDYLE